MYMYVSEEELRILYVGATHKEGLLFFKLKNFQIKFLIGIDPQINWAYIYIHVSKEELKILCVGAAESSQAHLSFVKKNPFKYTVIKV